MDQLFIEIEICTRNDETEIFTRVPSFVALYVYRFLNSPGNIKLRFVRTTFPPGSGKLKLRSELLCTELTEEIICKEAYGNGAIRSDLRLPVYAKDGNTYIAGMCAVCREIVARQECAERRKLLGFKDSCLLAPAEASIWTRFCEVDLVTSLNRLLYSRLIGEEVHEMPAEVSRFERHMNEPVRMHNIYKLAREQANRQKKELTAPGTPAVHENQPRKAKKGKIIIDCTTPKEQLPIEHRFAEGIVFTIADLILYPSLRLIFQFYPDMLEHFPLISTWFSEIDGFDPSCGRVLRELHMGQPVERQRTGPLKIVACEATSLYKNDPKRYKPRNRIYTDQSEVDVSLGKLQSLQVEFTSECAAIYDQNTVNWNTIEPEHAVSSALPQERIVRKRQQLENVANAVVSLAAPEDRIIDFCSGTGHLGILLAAQLPRCTIILMENKAISLERAKRRAVDLQLQNVLFYQCNIDYFEGPFEIGTALHACGTATDIVLQQCRRTRAKFACCPCCYGSLQPMPHICYPLSKRFRSVLNEREYLFVAHTADQAHELGTLNCKPETTAQGLLCMDIIDTDRKLQAEEAGYEVILTRLKPEKCTPKNRLLVGHFPAVAVAAAVAAGRP